MESIHGKELFNLANLVAPLSRDVHLFVNHKQQAVYLKDIAQTHFGVSPERFENISDQRIIESMSLAETSLHGSRYGAQLGIAFMLVSIPAAFFGEALALLIPSLVMLNFARVDEKHARVRMKDGLEKMKPDIDIPSV